MDKQSCLECRYFRSFRDDYDDPQEPDNYGFCVNPHSPYNGNEGAGENIVCDYFELKFEEKEAKDGNPH